MSPADRDAYRAALEPLVLRAKREGKVLTHVRYRAGQVDAVLERPRAPEPQLL